MLKFKDSGASMFAWDSIKAAFCRRSAATFLVSAGIAAASLAFLTTPATAFVCQDAVQGDGGSSNATGGNSTSNIACGVFESATASDQSSVAVGNFGSATGSNSTTVGDKSFAGGIITPVTGASNAFTNPDNTAIGAGSEAGARAAGENANTVVGSLASSNVLNGTALGQTAHVTADNAVALGQGSLADRANAVSVGTSSATRQIINVAAGTAGTDAVNLNQLNSAIAGIASPPIAANNANTRPAPTATGTDSVAVGWGASAAANNSTAIGNNSSVTAGATNSVAVGFGSVANAANTFSIGSAGAERKLVNLSAGAIASGSTDGINGAELFTANQRVAAVFGGGANLDVNGQLIAPTYTIQGSTFNNVGGAMGALDAVVTTINNNGTKYFQSNSTGPGASATGTNSIAVGSGAQATQTGSIAIGFNSASTGANAIAIGTGAVATGSVAVGSAATAANGGAAFGDGATATGVASTAIGPGATATLANSTAIGNGAVATTANQVAIGTATNTYRMAGIASAASLAAQSGPTNFVTTDSSGNLAASSFSPAAITSLQSQVTSLQSQVLDNRMEARTGTAVALAAGSMPALQPGRKFALSAGYGNFEGANAFGVGATALLYDGKSFAVVGNVGGAVGLERSAGGGRGAVSFQW
jgi:trimeric autotransporter adhesin